jgi:hypothetical protein
MKNNDFKLWVERIWRDNCAENFLWNDSVVSFGVYFNKYKWWLRREYRYQHRK